MHPCSYPSAQWILSPISFFLIYNILNLSFLPYFPCCSPWLQSPCMKFWKPVVSNSFGASDQFCGKHVFLWTDGSGVGWLGMSQRSRQSVSLTFTVERRVPIPGECMPAGLTEDELRWWGREGSSCKCRWSFSYPATTHILIAQFLRGHRRFYDLGIENSTYKLHFCYENRF